MKTPKLFMIMGVVLILVGCQTPATSSPNLTDTPKMQPTLTPEPISTIMSTKVSIQPTNTPKPSTPVPTSAPKDCSEGWTQLKIGMYAKVTGAEDDSPNRVRSKPVKGENIIAQIYPGDIVKIIEGPVCADGLVFWKVENATIPDGVGWTAEGDNLNRWLEQYTYIPGSVQLSNFGVNIIVPGDWSGVPDSEIVGSGSNEFCKWPEHIKIILTKYPAVSSWKPVIYVHLTSDQPDWYPLCPGAPLLRVQQKSLEHGSRLLFGSKNAQPIFNSELIYAYEGRSSDGKHTIFAFMPVNYPFLAYSFKNLSLPSGGIPFDVYASDWEPYYHEVGQQLEAAVDADFTPNLSLLDQIMGSIFVTEP